MAGRRRPRATLDLTRPLAASDEHTEELLRALILSVRPEDVIEPGSVSVETFSLTRRAAFLDLFSSLEGEDLEERFPEGTDLEALRSTAVYERVMGLLVDGWEAIREGLSLKGMMDDPRAAADRSRRLQSIATLARDPKVAIKALELFADREVPAPRFAPPNTQPIVIMVEGGHAELLEHQAIREIKEFHDGKPRHLDDGEARED